MEKIEEKLLIPVSILLSIILFVIIGFAILSDSVNPIAKLSFLLCYGLWGVGIGMVIMANEIQRGGKK